VLAGCDSSPSLPIGKDVVVQFDRSSLGAAASLPVPPTTEGINGAGTAIRGKLLGATKSWIQLGVTTSRVQGASVQTFWIPREKILLIQTDSFQGQ
jgi:hypothetical protein